MQTIIDSLQEMGYFDAQVIDAYYTEAGGLPNILLMAYDPNVGSIVKGWLREGKNPKDIKWYSITEREAR